VAHPAFDNDERCRDPRPEGATIVSIFRVPNARPARTLAQPSSAPDAGQAPARRAAGRR
jgi:hypothetical protein